VSLGADGAACNNHLDMFGEMRLAAALQSARRHPGALTARQVLWMATRSGARALGLEGQIGSVEVGKRADLVLIKIDAPHAAPGPDPFSAIVYAARPDDVVMTMVEGEILVRNGAAVHLDATEIAADAVREARALARRAGL
jgi:5-methylthioadenosine/S-adenosylhomocysteine deaminase